MDDHEQGGGGGAAAFISTPPSAWGPTPHVYPHSHHGTPAQEFTRFNFGSPPIPIDSAGYGQGLHSRPVPQQLQPLVMPQWPSMLSAQSPPTAYPPFHPTPIQPAPTAQHNLPPIACVQQLQTPVSASSNKSISPNPRRTLTDSDRKRMCEFAEEHPNLKQMEIGARFGVERSTVSKVLRQKEKYMQQDEGSRSPAKRVKNRTPDIERTLANWAKKKVKEGKWLTDDMIRDQARAFLVPSAGPEVQPVPDAAWIEKFKQTYRLTGLQSGNQGSLRKTKRSTSTADASSQTMTSTSSGSCSPLRSPNEVKLRNSISLDSMKHDDHTGNYMHFTNPHLFHSQELGASVGTFSDPALPTFSPGPLSPTSPVFTAIPNTTSGAFQPQYSMTRAIAILPAPTEPDSHRPRSQSYPSLEAYLPSSAAGRNETPKYLADSVLDSPMNEDATAEAPNGVPDLMTSETMLPPPLPAHVTPLPTPIATTVTTPMTAQASLATPTSATSSLMHHSSVLDGGAMRPLGSTASQEAAANPEEAAHALELVLNFFNQRSCGLALDFQEALLMSKLMEKLRMHTQASL